MASLSSRAESPGLCGVMLKARDTPSSVHLDRRHALAPAQGAWEDTKPCGGLAQLSVTLSPRRGQSRHHPVHSSRPSAALLPLAHGFSQAGSLDAAPGVSAKARRSLPELTQGSCAEDGVNRLSVKVTSSDSGSSGRRKLQSFFRAVNARRKTH
ncbi:unnamed protein product [Rangifer tarandus platyrhynchus]|uniref:Uncharacterized protein n=1 Tax=Rangifer tarandus platyrhynchus TaxID=3082113 RepID=A0ABN8YQT5_RANTA|nr:unnamed protein product [Rangifer tarandus platyrhynchus]